MNNRQSGRRRGRNNNNNSRSQSGGRGGVDQANRIDSRARGNAAQMIEKYKNLARDAQLSGDRVQTEYYLQFADHYFRVLSDFRARQDERSGGQSDRQDRHREIRGVEDFDAHDDTDLDVDGDRSDDGDSQPQGGRDRRDEGDGRGDRPKRERGNRRGRDADRGEDEGRDAGDAPDEAVAEAEQPAPRSRRSPRRPRAAEVEESSAGIDTAALPPAIGRPDRSAEPAASDEAAEPAPKPRRTRRTLATRGTDVEAAAE